MTRSLKVLHLAFEDHRRPGSGGGSARNRAVNRRLAEHHDVTVVTTRYPGARARTEDGVRYEQLGLGRGYAASLMSYFALLPWFVWRRGRDYDLVVEEFAAPLSSVSVPRWTHRPTLAVVQWFNAREKSEQYHLPFAVFERSGLRAHRDFIVMSEDLRDRVLASRPGASVRVIPNGVDDEAFDVTAPTTADVVYLGRLEIAQKGLDLLLQAYAHAADRVDGCLVIAGDGPDDERLRELATDLGISGRVRFVGRVEGRAKLELLAGARVVAMPSRFETFGMVAVEAQACGAPVVAFDIPCLREVVRPPSGRLVTELSVTALAEALVEVHGDVDGREAIDRAGRELARSYRWDEIADDQARYYLDVVARAEAAS